MSTTGHYSGQNAGLVYDTEASSACQQPDYHGGGCPCGMGGDPVIEVRAPKSAWCWLCRRSTPPTNMVDTEDGPEAICDECLDREFPDLNREGDPAWNGAFDRW